MGYTNRRMSPLEFVDVLMEELDKAGVDIRSLKGIRFSTNGRPLTAEIARVMAQDIARDCQESEETQNRAEEPAYRPKRLREDPAPAAKKGNGYQIPSAKELLSDIRKTALTIHGIMNHIETEGVENTALFALADANGTLKRNLDMLDVLVHGDMDPKMDKARVEECFDRYGAFASAINDLLDDILL